MSFLTHTAEISLMYAIVRTGGKQIKVAAGDVVKVERLMGDAGDKVTLDEILLVSDGSKVSIGSPLVKDAKVTATILEQARDRKVTIFKKRRRHNYRRKKGHRQHLTVLQVMEITAGGKTTKAEKVVASRVKPAAAAKAPAAKAAKAAPAKAAAKPAEKKAAAAKPAAAAKKTTAAKPAAKKPAAKKTSK